MSIKPEKITEKDIKRSLATKRKITYCSRCCGLPLGLILIWYVGYALWGFFSWGYTPSPFDVYDRHSYPLHELGMRMGFVELPEPEYYCSSLDLEVINGEPALAFGSGHSAKLYYCQTPIIGENNWAFAPHRVGNQWRVGHWLALRDRNGKPQIFTSGNEHLFIATIEKPMSTADWNLSSGGLAEYEDSKKFIWVDSEPAVAFFDSHGDYTPMQMGLNGWRSNLIFARSSIPMPNKPEDWLMMKVLDTGRNQQGWEIFAISKIGNIPFICATTQNGIEVGYPANPRPDFANEWMFHTLEKKCASNYIEILDYLGVPVVIWSDSSSGDLRCAMAKIEFPKQASDWLIHTIDSDQAIRDPSVCLIGDSIAIAYQAGTLVNCPSMEGRGHYYDYGSGTHELRYAQATSNLPASTSDWSIQVVDGPAPTGYLPDLCEYDGQPLIAFFDAQDTSVKLARGITNKESSTISFEHHTVVCLENIEVPEDNAYHRYLMGIDD